MQAVTGAPAREQAIASPTDNAEAGFFSFHGPWAPGVRLFRRLRFQSKAALIALSFIIPIALLLTQYLSRANAEISALDNELAGAVVIEHLAPIQHALTDMRNASRAAGAGYTDAAGIFARGSKALPAAVDELITHLKDNGDLLAVGTEAQALRTAAQGLGDKPDSKAVEGVLAQVRSVTSLVASRSGLLLDTDLVDLHLVLAYTEDLPRLAEGLGQLRGWGSAALAGNRADQAAVNRSIGWAARAEAQLGVMREKLAVVQKADPKRAGRLDLAWLDGAERYIKKAQAQFQGGEAAEVGAWFTEGTSLVDAAYKAQEKAMPLLADSLALRADGARSQRLSEVTLCAVFLALSFYLFHSFFLVMQGGLREVRRHLRAMSSGDLTQSPQPWGKDELARLMESLSEMQASLRSMVSRVRSSSDEIVHSSTEIAEGAMDLSARTEQTAASLEESAAAMEQIAATVKHTAEYAQEATGIANENAAVAARGGEVIGQMVRTMEDIHASSSKIGDIIGVIDGIAFQTNILALNAAVEAARAGETGRGFAVVASEVRALAQRSAGAAREIKSLISASVEQVAGGTRIVREAGNTMQDIVSGAARVNGLLVEIATGAREQSLGVGQVGQTVQELDRGTQQNAALVEQTAAASAALKALATSLAEEVSNFQLPAGAGADAAAALSVPQRADFDFDSAIEAHRAWKVKLRQAIAHKERLDADTICRDDACALGRWLHGPGGQQWGSRPVFVALVEKHAAFHKTACCVAKAINGGNYAQADQLLGSGSDFAEASREVGTLLTQAKRGF